MGVGSGWRFFLLEIFDCLSSLLFNNTSIFFLCKRTILPFKKFPSIMLTTRHSKSLTPFEPFFQKKFKNFFNLLTFLTTCFFKSSGYFSKISLKKLKSFVKIQLLDKKLFCGFYITKP